MAFRHEQNLRRPTYSGVALKQAAWEFLSGKAISAAITLAITLTLVRLLPISDYGAYVVLIASVEIGYAIAGFGIPWLAARFIPEYRLNGSGACLIRLCRALFLWQSTALIFLSLLIVALLNQYLNWSNLNAYRSGASLALGLLVTEGLFRFTCGALLGPLLLQGAIRASLVLRQLIFLSAVAVLSLKGSGSLDSVLLAELIAAFVGALTSLASLWRHLTGLRNQEGIPNWHEPSLQDQWAIASRMYLAHLMTLATTPQIFLNIVQRFLGSEAAALFGFLRILYAQAAQYLPATLLFSLIRPKLMASYLQGGMPDLQSQATFAGKLSLFTLMPAILVVALAGDVVIALLSGGKFLHGGWLLLGMLVTLVPFSQRQLLESVAVAAGRAGLCTIASTYTLIALPVMMGLLALDFGLWSPVLAMLIGQIIFNLVVTRRLAGLGYRPDWAGNVKIATATMLSWLVAHAVTLAAQPNTSWSIGLGLLSGLASYFFVTWIVKPFRGKESAQINAIFGRKVFVW